jgi:Asp-tRNA(Asn)/Glu-tRNA(Gln) amidotransferase A subunit family amidase
MTVGSGDLRLSSVAALVSDIAARRLSPVELFDDIAARIDAVEPQVHAFITLDLENARRRAGERVSRSASKIWSRRRDCGPPTDRRFSPMMSRPKMVSR